MAKIFDSSQGCLPVTAYVVYVTEDTIVTVGDGACTVTITAAQGQGVVITDPAAKLTLSTDSAHVAQLPKSAPLSLGLGQGGGTPLSPDEKAALTSLVAGALEKFGIKLSLEQQARGEDIIPVLAISGALEVLLGGGKVNTQDADIYHGAGSATFSKTEGGHTYSVAIDYKHFEVRRDGELIVYIHADANGNAIMELNGERVATVADDYGAMLASQVDSGFSNATSLPVTALWEGLIEHTCATRGLLYMPNVTLPSNYSDLNSNLNSVPWASISSANSVVLSSQSLAHATFVLGGTNRGQANYNINCPAAIVRVTHVKADARTGIACLDSMKAKKIVFSAPLVTSLWISSYPRPRFCFLRTTGDVSGVTLYVNAPVLTRLGDASSSGSTANEDEFALISSSTGYPHIYLNMPSLGQSMHLFLAENSTTARTLYFRKEELLYLFTHIKRTPDADGAEIKLGVDASLYDASSGTWLDADLDAAAAALETPATAGANAWTLNIITNA